LAWNKYYDDLTEYDKDFYNQVTENNTNWFKMSAKQLQDIKNAWNILGRDINYGWRSALVAMSQENINFAQGYYDMLSGLQSSVEGFFVDWYTNLEDFGDVWKSFLKNLYSEFIKWMAKMAAAEVFKTVIKGLLSLGTAGVSDVALAGLSAGAPLPIPFANGGIAKGGLQIPKLAGGGVYKSPTLAIIGEGANDEAVVPLKHGKIPVDMRSQPNVNLTIQQFTLSLPNMDWDSMDTAKLQSLVNRRLVPAIKQAAADGFLNKAIA